MSHLSEIEGEFRSLPYLHAALAEILAADPLLSHFSLVEGAEVAAYYREDVKTASLAITQYGQHKTHASVGFVQEVMEDGYPGAFKMAFDPWGVLDNATGGRRLLESLGGEGFGEYRTWYDYRGSHHVVKDPARKPGRLIQRYTLVAAETEGKRRGMAPVRIPQADGSILLRLTNPRGGYLVLLAREDGTCTTQVYGVNGPGCLKDPDWSWVSSLLGKVTRQTKTADFHKAPARRQELARVRR